MRGGVEFGNRVMEIALAFILLAERHVRGRVFRIGGNHLPQFFNCLW